MMKRKALIKKAGTRVIVAAIALLGLIPFVASTPGSYFEISKNLDIFATLYKELNTYYVDDVEPSKLMRHGIDGMLQSLDPYTNFISEAEMEQYRMQTTGKYGGIGALIRTTGEWVIVAEPYKGFPADNAGLIAGDKILEVDGTSAKGKNTEEVSSLLKGAPETDVELKISRTQADGSEKEMNITLTRGEIKIDNVPYYGMINDKIGYIRLRNFTEYAGKEVKEAMEELKLNPELEGVVFDLRGNPGGLLNEAVNVSNVFIQKGQEIVSTKGKVTEWDKSFKTLNPAVDISIPLVVLTNSGSASASEIVSGSIQDLDRGVVLGQKTFGKGLVQTTRSLNYNTKLKVTTAKYYIPSGRCIQAIDYAEKNEDGSVAHIPDSLKTAFKTYNGRTVFDGGGITPDIEVDRRDLSNIAVSLLTKNHIFNFATLYRAKHESIPPAKTFALTDAEYEEFVDFLSGKDYDYSTESEDLLKELQESAKEEEYYDAVQDDLEELETGIQHDKDRDLFKHKDEIIGLLEEEIASRYYYNEGRIEASFAHDNEVQEALNVLATPTEYEALLSPDYEDEE